MITHPNNDSSLLVCGPDLEVGAFGNMVVQEVQERIGLLLLKSNDFARKALVDEESFLPGDGMNAYDWVLRGDTLPADDATVLARALGLFDARMKSVKSPQECLECG